MGTATASANLFKASHNKSGQAQSLKILAECCVKKNNWPEAVYRIEEAAFLYRQIKDKKAEGTVLSALSQLQLRMIDAGLGVAPAVKEPLRHARRAASLLDESRSGTSLEAAEANHAAARALFTEKETEEAVMYASQARDIYEKLGIRIGEAASCALLAQIHFLDKAKEQGLKMAQRSLELAQEVGDQGLLVLAADLVENQGKQKQQSLVELTDIDLIWEKVRLARFDEFEGRRARYKAVDGGSSISTPAIEDGVKSQGLAKKDEQKVQYAIRWQRVPNLNLSAMPYPPAVAAK